MSPSRAKELSGLRGLSMSPLDMGKWEPPVLALCRSWDPPERGPRGEGLLFCDCRLPVPGLAWGVHARSGADLSVMVLWSHRCLGCTQRSPRSQAPSWRPALGTLMVCLEICRAMNAGYLAMVGSKRHTF